MSEEDPRWPVIGKVTVERDRVPEDQPLIDMLESLDLPLGNGKYGEGRPEDS